MNSGLSLFGIDRNQIKTPSQLYRMLRPEYFSDSVVEKEKLSRDQFKYAMSQLSTEMRQDAFEEFTRRCIQKLITPNIIPQTGPTGGGDAKADLVTYPVSKEVSSLWHVPEGGCGSDDKWSFAISTVQKWSGKMDRDVKKIMENIPDCTRIYFCTNQSVASRSRLAKQKKYKEEYNVNTEILDLNWYVQAVYDQGCYDDAIETLGLGDNLKLVKKLGPLDTERELQLIELDKIQPKSDTNGYDDQYVKNLIDSARLARELERPRQEVEGRYAAALESAKKYGLPQQVFECIYQRAWTEYYWYDNAEATYECYYELKKMVDDEVNMSRIERLFTLFQILVTSFSLRQLKKDIDVKKEFQYFTVLYDRLKNDPQRTSCTMYLRICLLEFELMYRAPMTDNYDSEKVEAIIAELTTLIKEATHRLDIPFDFQSEVLVTIGQLYDRNKAFESLVDLVANIQSSRDKDVSAASIHYHRGLQNIESGNFDDAIRHLSRCYVWYQKENTQAELIRTSAFLGYAYAHLDLLYNAKVCYVKSLSFMVNKMGNEGKSDHLIFTLLLELCELELNLGQVVIFLEWLALFDAYLATLPSYLSEDIISRRAKLDALLGSLLYETPLQDEKLSVLPDIFKRYQLEFSRSILLIKMGKQDLLSDEFKFLIETEENTKRFVDQMSDHASFLFPLIINSDKKGQLQTLVHGCTICARYSGATYEQTYSEMVLACIEMLLESSVTKSIPSMPVLTFDINCVSEGITEVKEISTGVYRISINKNNFASYNDIWGFLIQTLANVLSGGVMVKDLGAFLLKRQEDDFLMQRISLLTSYLSDINNIIPTYRRPFVEMYVSHDDQKYTFKIEKDAKTKSYTSKQSDAIITDLIDVHLWDEARWKGCGYMIYYDFSEPGIMVLLFENIKSGIKIFEKWENDYRNQKLNLKVVIITGVDENHPNWYKVLITPDMKEAYLQQHNPTGRFVIGASRFHLMNARSNENIIMLRQSYARHHYIGLSASAFENNQMSQDKDKRYNRVIPVPKLEFREAWTIGTNDPESVAILGTDKVIIPDEHRKDAPVLSVLAKKRQNGEEK